MEILPKEPFINKSCNLNEESISFLLFTVLLRCSASVCEMHRLLFEFAALLDFTDQQGTAIILPPCFENVSA